MVNTHSGAKVYIVAAAQASAPVNAAGYAALTWIEIGGVGRMGEIGTKDNILSYNRWSTGVSDKQKGIADAGSPELEVARDVADAGQDAIRAAALTNLAYAFKVEYADKLTGAGTNGIIYNWGIVGGPTRPQGRNEDFIVEVFSLGFKVRETVVDPT